MPFRFRKSFGPKGLKLNVSKTGFSVSAGVRGAHVNYDLSGRRKKPIRGTVGLPGTGLSYYQDMGKTGTTNRVGLWVVTLIVLVLAAILLAATMAKANTRSTAQAESTPICIEAKEYAYSQLGTEVGMLSCFPSPNSNGTMGVIAIIKGKVHEAGDLWEVTKIARWGLKPCDFELEIWTSMCSQAKEIETGVTPAEHNKLAREHCSHSWLEESPQEYMLNSDEKHFIDSWSKTYGEQRRWNNEVAYPQCLKDYLLPE